MLHHFHRLPARMRQVFFGPAYHPADHSALAPRGGTKGVRAMLLVVGSLWFSLVVFDNIARPWQRQPKNFWVFKGANALNQAPDLDHEPWPLEGNLARKLAVKQLRRFYEAGEDTTRRWLTTDAYGYRLGTSPAPYKIVLCGDSFFDNEIIADSVAHYTGMSTGNMAIDGRGPLSMSRFLYAAPPEYRGAKIVVWGKEEAAINRSEFESMVNQAGELNLKSGPRKWKHNWEQSLLWPNCMDVYFTESSLLKVLANAAASEASYQLIGEHTSEVILGKQNLATGQLPMLFLHDDIGLKEAPKTGDLIFIADKIAAVDKQLRQRGITLFFTPIPDKTTVYRERLPNGVHFRGVFTNVLANLLKARGVKTINLSEGIRQAALINKLLPLYYATDTHWNKTGQILGAQIIADSINR